MSEFEFSTLGVLLALLVLLGGYSYWQVYRVQRARAARVARETPIEQTPEEPITPTPEEKPRSNNWGANLARSSWHDERKTPVTVAAPVADGVQHNVTYYIEDEPAASAAPMLAPSDAAALMVFEPMVRLSSWLQTIQSSPVHGIDGVLDATLSQPKNKTDIENALYDLRLDTDLPLRLYGRRAGQSAATWQPLDAGALYNGLRLTLQLADAGQCADVALLSSWFELAQKLTKRLAAAHIQTFPNSAELADYAFYLHHLAQKLAAPMVVQLHCPAGFWAANDVHHLLTQLGLNLSTHGQYNARADTGHVLYSVLNDINNPHAQDFIAQTLPAMQVSTLSFCLDLARVDAAHQPSLRLWHDMRQIAASLQAVWCNAQGELLDVDALMHHADVHINAYYQQLYDLNIPAGSTVLRRLLHK